MYLKELKLWNFRKYGINGDSFEAAEPGLTVKFNDGVNVLVGENDSGKTSIIDAIRYVLKTQSQEFIQLEDKDFFKNEGNDRSIELKIECTFSGFKDEEAANFLEWIGFDEDKNYILRIWLYAKRKDLSVFPTIRAGLDSEGSYIEGEARDLLRVTYLKPLRDALNELTSGRNSRLYQILKSHSVFQKTKSPDGVEEKHDLEKIFFEANKQIQSYFKDNKGTEILNIINNSFLKKFLLQGDQRNSEITITENELSEILKKLNLILEENKSGLGSLNLLFIAAELLHLASVTNGLKLTLIEELEAHLHPQFQLRLIDFIQNNKKYGQFILSTHSTTLASKINLENLIICHKEKVFPMGHNYTMLEEGDYKFLERFLDATKANLFFAKGVIFVEGDSENLLIPTIAEIIERPLHNYGVSIINIGNIAFQRYSRIFLRRKQGESDIIESDYFQIPVAILTDLDIPSIEYYGEDIENKVVLINGEMIEKLNTLTQHIDFSQIKDHLYISINGFWNALSEIKSNRLEKGERKKIKAIFEESWTAMKSEFIDVLRKQKIEFLGKKFNQQKVRVFPTKCWTLEYEFAQSGLNKELLQAILTANELLKDDHIKLDRELMAEIQEKSNKFFVSNSALSSEEIAFKIYDIIKNSEISKTVISQCLAKILKGNQERIKPILISDPFLKYIIDAICYVTKPI